MRIGCYMAASAVGTGAGSIVNMLIGLSKFIRENLHLVVVVGCLIQTIATCLLLVSFIHHWKTRYILSFFGVATLGNTFAIPNLTNKVNVAIAALVKLRKLEENHGYQSTSTTARAVNNFSKIFGFAIGVPLASVIYQSTTGHSPAATDVPQSASGFRNVVILCIAINFLATLIVGIWSVRRHRTFVGKPSKTAIAENTNRFEEPDERQRASQDSEEARGSRV